MDSRLTPSEQAQPAETWPAAADAAAARRLAERFAALGPDEAALAGTSRGAAVLAALGATVRISPNWR